MHRSAAPWLLGLLVLAAISDGAAAASAQTSPAGISEASPQAPPALTPAQWQEDVAFLAERIRTVHPASFRYVSESAFDSAVASLDAAIPRLSSEEVVVGVLRLLALVRDGHTTMPMAFPGFGAAAIELLAYHQLPLRFYAFEEGTYVVDAFDPAFASLVGRKLLTVDGVPADSVLALAMDASPTDNRYGAVDHATELMRVPELLRGMGVAGDPVAVELTTASADGERTVTVPAAAASTETHHAATGDPDAPLYLRHRDRPYWSEYLPADRTMYVQYNVVLNRGEMSIEEFFDGVFADAEAKGAERMVLDLRYNTGGNNSLNWPIIYDIIRSDRVNRRGHLFVVIGRRTFSAAQNAVNGLGRHTHAVFVGEPTAAHPNHYGDAIHFTLPNSGLPFQVSALYWQHHPRDTREWTAPEIYAPPTAEAYFDGRDVALEAIRGWDTRPVFDRLVDALESGGVEAAVEQYRAFRGDPRNRFVDVEGDLNQLGYTLVRSGDAPGALGVFRLVVEAYPESANAWDSYGEGLWRVGRTAEAVEAYERAVRLDPDGFVGRNSRAMLGRIEAGESPP